MHRTACLLLSLSSILSLALQAQSAARDSLLPSSALHVLNDSLTRVSGDSQGKIASGLLRRTRTHGLESAEVFALAELRFAAFDPDGAHALFLQFMNGSDLRARIARQRVLRIAMAARDQYAGVEDTLAAMRRRLAPMPEDPWHFSSAVSTLAKYHADRGDHQAVVRIVLDEVRALPLDGLYFSHLLPATYLSSFAQVGQRDAAIAHLVAVRDAQLSARRSTRGETPPATPHRAGVFHRLEEGLLRDLPNGEPERFLRGRLVGLLYGHIARAQALP